MFLFSRPRSSGDRASVSETVRRRFESCRGHIKCGLGLMVVVMSMAMRLISICAPER